MKLYAIGIYFFILFSFAVYSSYNLKSECKKTNVSNCIDLLLVLSAIGFTSIVSCLVACGKREEYAMTKPTLFLLFSMSLTSLVLCAWIIDKASSCCHSADSVKLFGGVCILLILYFGGWSFYYLFGKDTYEQAKIAYAKRQEEIQAKREAERQPIQEHYNSIDQRYNALKNSNQAPVNRDDLPSFTSEQIDKAQRQQLPYPIPYKPPQPNPRPFNSSLSDIDPYEK